MNVSEAIDTVRDRAQDANGNLKPEAELQEMIRDAADNSLMNFATGGLPSAVEGLMDSHFDGNATAMITFLEEHKADFGDRDAVQFIESGGAAAYIEATRRNEALEASRLAAAEQAPEVATPAEDPAPATETPQVAETAPETPAVVAGAAAGAGVAATTAGGPTDAVAAMDRVMAENQTPEGTSNFLEMLRNMDMDQFDANGDGQVGFGELFMGLIETFMGEEQAGEFREMMASNDNPFNQMFGNDGTFTMGASLSEQAGLQTGNAVNLDPSTGEPVPTPGQQPVPGTVTPGMDPNDPTLTGPRAPGMSN